MNVDITTQTERCVQRGLQNLYYVRITAVHLREDTRTVVTPQLLNQCYAVLGNNEQQQ